MSDTYSLFPTQVVIYSTRACSDCRLARVFFESNHIPHLEVEIDGDERATLFVSDLNHGFHSVPTIIFPDGSILVEPSWDELKTKFLA
jgi:mycoredoxin